jgi:predicted metalloprotease with PDZ domain
MLTPRDLSRLATLLGGLPIPGCSAGSPAAEAGLCYGDIILSADELPVASWSALLAVCERASAELSLRVMRAGRELSLHMRAPATFTPRGVLGDPASSAIAQRYTPEDGSPARASLDLC